jgi:hypothetical protein
MPAKFVIEKIRKGLKDIRILRYLPYQSHILSITIFYIAVYQNTKYQEYNRNN